MFHRTRLPLPILLLAISESTPSASMVEEKGGLGVLEYVWVILLIPGDRLGNPVELD